MSNKVLVVDDSMLIRRQVGRVLTQAGFEVVEAVDGGDALQKVTSSPDFQLVVCDVNMPTMSGIEFLEQLREHKPAISVPVVMLTTEGQPELIHRAKALGAKGWIIKPFKPDLLVAAAKKLSASNGMTGQTTGGVHAVEVARPT